MRPSSRARQTGSSTKANIVTMRGSGAVALGFLALLAGCGGSSKPKNAGGVNINVPGVSIQVDDQGNTQVNAPGVKAVFYGLTLMAIISFRPSGVWPWLARLLGVGEKAP